MRSILVTRPQPAADEFAAKLRREGFVAHMAPMMEYADVPASLSDMADYQALIFTSARAVRIFSRYSQERQMPVLAVGDATAAAAEESGFSAVYSANGDSADIVKLIQDKAGALALKKALHLCSEDTPHDIGMAVADIDVEVVRRTVYKAHFTDKFPDDVLQALKKNSIDTVTLFSARTAANLVALMQQRGLRGISTRLQAVCISERVADELKKIPWRTIRVASHPNMESVLEILKDRCMERFSNDENRRLAEKDRREMTDRRRAHASSYAGSDRRAGTGRRAYEKLQRERVMKERLIFLNRSVLTFAFMFIAIVLAAVFMMAPEYYDLSRIVHMAGQPKEQAAQHKEKLSIGGEINNQIEKIENSADPLSEVAGRIGSSAKEAIEKHDLQGFSQMFDTMAELRSTPGGSAAVDQALKNLRSIMAESPGNPGAINEAVKTARSHDRTLGYMLGQVGGKDLAAAAMLLVLNEFRSNVDNHRPYSEDLALLQKFAGNDPGMNRALQRLSPYSEKGVMSREALQKEFKDLAADIVLAKMEGRDISVKEDAQMRIKKLLNAGQNPETIVARAKSLLDKGDVKGAINELRTLEGASAQAAEPWINDAAGNVIAEESSGELTQGILQAISGGSGSSIEDLFLSIRESIRGADVPYMSPALKKGGSDYEGVIAPATP